MRLIKLLIVLLGAAVPGVLNAQSVISFMGGSLENSAMTLAFTGGEALAGSFSGSSISVTGGFGDGSSYVSTAAEIPEIALPVSYRLNQNYPNPFNPSTKISYELPKASNVILEVFSSIGAKVAVLENGRKPAGSYVVTFNASSFASGMYFYRFISNGEIISTRKMLLIK